MQDVTGLLDVNFASLFMSACDICVILVGLKFIITLFEWFFKRIGLETKWMREKKENQEFLKNTSDTLIQIQEQQTIDREHSNEHDENIRKDLSGFIIEMRDYINENKQIIEKFAEDRIYDREQSLHVQKELENAIKSIIDEEKNRDRQIEALMCGSKELLGSEIDKRYREYIALKGIPETEISEFDDIYVAYKALNGNHSRDSKYNYAKNNLSILPVETKLIKE